MRDANTIGDFMEKMMIARQTSCDITPANVVTDRESDPKVFPVVTTTT